MQKQGQKLSQKQSLQQKLSPQQIQYIKLLQLPTIALEQRIKEELELNPVLELNDPAEPELEESLDELEREWEGEDGEASDDPDPVDQNEEIDWDSFLHNTENDGHNYGAYNPEQNQWRGLPRPTTETLLGDLAD